MGIVETYAGQEDQSNNKTNKYVPPQRRIVESKAFEILRDIALKNPKGPEANFIIQAASEAWVLEGAEDGSETIKTLAEQLAGLEVQVHRVVKTDSDINPIFIAESDRPEESTR